MHSTHVMSTATPWLKFDEVLLELKVFTADAYLHGVNTLT